LRHVTQPLPDPAAEPFERELGEDVTDEFVVRAQQTARNGSGTGINTRPQNPSRTCG